MKFKKILAGAMAGAMVLGSLTITSAETNAELLIDGLTAYYSFDDTLENTVTGGEATLHGGASSDTDDTWNEAATGTAAYATGKTGNAYSFTGDSTTRGEGLQLDVQTTDSFTLSGWVYTEEKINYQPIYFLAASTDDYLNCGTIFNDCWGGVLTMLGGWSGNVLWVDNYLYDIPLETWTYLTVTVTSDGTVSFYFNGELANSGTFDSYNGEFSGVDLFLGINYWNESFKGLMDEVTVYSSALTADQISALYTNNGCPYVYGVYTDSATIYMTVDQEKSAADAITLYPTSLSISDVTYEVTEGSDYINVATDGTITALAKGDAVITVTYKDTTAVTNASATLNVSVTDPNSVTGITSSISEATLTVGNTITLSGTAVAEKSGSPITDSYNITYVSSDTSIATVNASTGVVTAVAAGTATITITVSGTDKDGGEYSYDATVALTVEAAAATTTESESETTAETDATSTSTTTETESESEEAVYTLVDEYDLDDTTIETWWATDSFTKSIALEESHQYVITGTTTNIGENSWNNVLYLLYSSDDGVIYTLDTTADNYEAGVAANYVEYLIARADNYAWDSTGNTYEGTLADGTTYTVISSPSSDDEWAEWTAATQAGQDFTITATYIDDTIQIEFVCGTVDYIMTYTVTDATASYYIVLGGEACTLSNLHVADYEVSGVVLTTGTDGTETTETGSETESESSAATNTTTTTTTKTTTTSTTGGADTGDASPIIPIALALLGCGAVVVASKKRMA